MDVPYSRKEAPLIMTVSEELFEDFCLRQHLPARRVAEVDGMRRPDYEIELSGHRVVVEVKQFDPNDEEAEATHCMEHGGVGTTSSKPGERIRRAIGSAAPQLKSLSKGMCPAMIVVFNNVISSGLHTDPYDVATAMQGIDKVPVLVPKNLALAPKFLDARSGPGKKMTADANTTISAIGVLFADRDGAPYLNVFHNRHARNPIEPDWLRAQQVRHFRLPDSATSSLDGWAEV